MKDIHHSCQGESHIVAGKVCQDASYSHTDASVSIAIVCDGHGGTRYFRSDLGAQFAVEACKECVASFVDNIDKSLFIDKPFVQKQAIATEVQSSTFTKETATDKALRQLFSSIIYSWRQRITHHAETVSLTEEEKQSVQPAYQAEFANGIGVEKTYGCTLMCFVYTSHYWFAFHIGDGKCIAFDTNGEWSEPIPWDDRCFLNKTTSLCDATAIDEFRYCYCGNGNHPMAIFLGSDGIDDSFGKTENMVNFYIQILKLIVNDGCESASNSVKETLPQLSKIGSQDDMSLACVYDENDLTEHIKELIVWQRTNVEKAIYDINQRILNLREKVESLKVEGLDKPQAMIDFQYANKQLAKAFADKKLLAYKWDKFSSELSHGDATQYDDEIGFGEAISKSEDMNDQNRI